MITELGREQFGEQSVILMSVARCGPKTTWAPVIAQSPSGSP